MPYESVVVVLATGGAILERDALDALPETTVTWFRIERDGRVGCLAARVRHPYRRQPDQWCRAVGRVRTATRSGVRR